MEKLNSSLSSLNRLSYNQVLVGPKGCGGALIMCVQGRENKAAQAACDIFDEVCAIDGCFATTTVPTRRGIPIKEKEAPKEALASLPPLLSLLYAVYASNVPPLFRRRLVNDIRGIVVCQQEWWRVFCRDWRALISFFIFKLLFFDIKHAEWVGCGR